MTTGVIAWRRYRRASRVGLELSVYTANEALELERLSTQLNEHGFQLEHTMAELGPKLEMISAFLEQPLVAVSIPWVLRRIFARPYRRR